MSLISTRATVGSAVRDSATMSRRQLLRLARYPSMTVMLLIQPLLFLVLFVYVFGGTMGAGLPGGDGRVDYLRFITPGVLMIGVAMVAISSAVSVALDMDKGIVDRFRTMAIAKSSVLTGHVLSALVQTVFVVVVTVAVAVLMGYRPEAGLGGWLASAALLLFLGFGMTWLGVAMGLAAGNVESASNMPMPLMLMPLLSSGFTPPDSMPAGLRHFAEYQPFTPIIETVRAFLTGGSAGADLWWALGWCAAFALVGYLWSRRTYSTVRAG